MYRSDAALSYLHHHGHLLSSGAGFATARRGEDDGHGGCAQGQVAAAAARMDELRIGNVMERNRRIGRLQVIENMVELVGIEPTASSLRTMRSPS